MLFVSFSGHLIFKAIQFIQTVLIQTIQFGMSINFVNTQLNVNIVQ